LRSLSLLQWTLLFMSMLTVMASTPIAPALPYIAEAFAGEPHAEVLTRLVLTMPALFVVLGAPLIGWLADRYGRKPIIILALAIYGTAGTTGFYAQSLEQILVGRALLGLAVAAIMSLSTTLIADYFSGDARARLMGLQGAFTTAAGVIFLSLGGFLADIHWRFTFLAYAAGLVLIPLALYTLYEPQHKHTVAADGDGQWPLRLMAVIYGCAVVGHVGFFILTVHLPFHLRDLFSIGGLGSGLMLGLATLFGTLSSLRYTWFKQHLRYIYILVLIFALLGCGLLLVGWSQYVWLTAVGVCLVGVSAGLLLPALNNWLSDLVAPVRRARALGLLVTSLFSGQFLSPLLAVPVMAALPGIGQVFLVFAAAALGICIALWLSAASIQRQSTACIEVTAR
jgi:MFS family permease